MKNRMAGGGGGRLPSIGACVQRVHVRVWCKGDTDHQGWTEWASGSEVGGLTQQPMLCRPPLRPLCEHTVGWSAEQVQAE